MMEKGVSFVFVVLVIFLLPACSPPGGGGVSPFRQVQKLTASDAADSDTFGFSVAMAGDYAIAGAANEDGAGSNRGAAYICLRNQGGADNWGEVKKLAASDAADDDFFGNSVAMAGNYVIVGAYMEDGAGSNRGAAYIYYRDQGGAGNWGEVKKLTASDAENGDCFGQSVAMAGDYAVVGALYENGAGSARGAAYIYYRDQGGAGNWGEVKKLTASDAANSDNFGNSVAMAGDYVIVGGPSEDGAGSDRGAAYIYYRNQGGADNWGEVTKLTAGDAQDSDCFGNSVAMAGDYVIVGVSSEDGTGSDRGAAYIYYRNQGGADNWGEVTKLTAGDAADNDYFGYAAAMSGDCVMVGAYGEDGSGSTRGAAYIYCRNEGGADIWGEVAKLTASDAENGDRFGISVAMAGDYAMAGAFYEDGAGNNRGAAYIYKKE